jgi:hypothetical protein
MAAYCGKKKWVPFRMHAELTMDRYEWTGEELLDCLVRSSRNRALEFSSNSPLADYSPLKEELDNMFGQKDALMTRRRQLQELRQKGNEDQDKLTGRALELATTGHPRARRRIVVEDLASGSLCSCNANTAALTVMNHQLKPPDEAVKIVEYASNQGMLTSDKSKVRLLPIGENCNLGEREPEEAFEQEPAEPTTASSHLASEFPTPGNAPPPQVQFFKLLRTGPHGQSPVQEDTGQPPTIREKEEEERRMMEADIGSGHTAAHPESASTSTLDETQVPAATSPEEDEEQAPVDSEEEGILEKWLHTQ